MTTEAEAVIAAADAFIAALEAADKVGLDDVLAAVNARIAVAVRQGGPLARAAQHCGFDLLVTALGGPDAIRGSTPQAESPPLP